MKQENINNAENYLSIALPVPLRSEFFYLQAEKPPYAEPGDRVSVSFGTRELIGLVIRNCSQLPDDTPKLKAISYVLDKQASMPTELLDLCKWASEYYLHPLGETILSALPPHLRQDKALQQNFIWKHSQEGLGLPNEALKRSPKQQEIHQFLLQHKTLTEDQLSAHKLSKSALKCLLDKALIEKTIETASENRPDAHADLQLLNEAPKPLNPEQQVAVDAVTFHNFNPHLLHGITGSGKTEVYLQLASKALQAGKQALILVPEIGLSPQTVERFKNRFAVKLVELHSDVSDVKRAQNWIAAKNGDARIIIGTRLAAFSPLLNAGIIIIDEEHDSAYKQQDGLRYSARDVCIYRAKSLNIPVVLGSATPSLESLNNAINKRYSHLVLRHRAGPSIPPDLIAVDLRNQNLKAGLSEYTLSEIHKTLDQGGQALVFLNRRGFAPAQLCHSCGWVSNCPSCSSSMTLHLKQNQLRCHHCDKQARPFRQCPNCGHNTLETRGVGTEQIEYVLQDCFPEIQVQRVDRDSTRSKKARAKQMTLIHSGQACILVGTQILAKGHHFPNLQLVVVVDADQGFLNPNFRAMEKMGQLLIQVAGRAGREEKKGKVLIQTHRPEHPLLQSLLHKGYTYFARQLLHDREQSQLAPYWHSATFKAESKRGENAQALLELISQQYQNAFIPSPNVAILGPMPSSIEKVQDRYRFELSIKTDNRRGLKEILKELLKRVDRHALTKRVRWSLDVDPLD